MTVLLSSSEKSYVRDNIESSNSYEKQEEDQDGPFDIGLKCVKATEDAESAAFI